MTTAGRGRFRRHLLNSQTGAIEDKHEAEDDLAKSKALASAAVREREQARLARQRAQSAERVLDLKTRVAALLKARADNESRRASKAQETVDKIKDRVQALREEIAKLRREARVKSIEADERVSVGQKLLSSSKELIVKAKTLQQQHLQAHPLSQKMVVSPKALNLMVHEARRVGKMLQVDSEGLHKAEVLLKSLPSQPDHPLETLHQRMQDTSMQLQHLSGERGNGRLSAR